MSLLTTLRKGVAIANKLTKSVQATVTYQRAVKDTSGYGNFIYPTSVPLKAVVDYASKQVRTQAGVLTVTRATIDILDIKALVAATNGQGVGNDDKFILPDGDTGPILDISGFIDAGTGNPFATRVMLG